MCSSMKSIKCLMAATTLLLGACGDERATMVENSTGTSALALAEIMEPSVDLLVGDALLTERALEPNQIVRVDATVVNRGGRAADKSQLRYLLSDDGVWDQGDTYLNYDAVPSLDPGELAREYANLRVPADWPYGAAYIFSSSQTQSVYLRSLKKRITYWPYRSRSSNATSQTPKTFPSLGFRMHHSRVASHSKVPWSRPA